MDREVSSQSHALGSLESRIVVMINRLLPDIIRSVKQEQEKLELEVFLEESETLLGPGRWIGIEGFQIFR